MREYLLRYASIDKNKKSHYNSPYIILQNPLYVPTCP